LLSQIHRTGRLTGFPAGRKNETSPRRGAGPISGYWVALRSS
jgi:hypothetical protein